MKFSSDKERSQFKKLRKKIKKYLGLYGKRHSKYREFNSEVLETLRRRTANA